MSKNKIDLKFCDYGRANDDANYLHPFWAAVEAVMGLCSSSWPEESTMGNLHANSKRVIEVPWYLWGDRFIFNSGGSIWVCLQSKDTKKQEHCINLCIIPPIVLSFVISFSLNILEFCLARLLYIIFMLSWECYFQSFITQVNILAMS